MVDLTINGGSQTLDGIQTYDYVNITNGGILYVTPYNGTGTTGRLILNVTEINVDSTSSIIGFKRGYRGGAWIKGGNCALYSYGGERQGYGGGGNGGISGGSGGGGYGTVGGKGGGFGGNGGPVQGTLDNTDIQMGNGGGAGGENRCDYSANPGESGGGMLTINAHNINIHGIVNFNGGLGGDGIIGGGGGASGGGILFNATNIDLSSANITVLGGAGGWGNSSDRIGKIGGGGRIKIFYSGTYNNSGATISAGTVYTQYNPPVTGSLNISSTPSGARIYIDNIDRGVVTSNIISDLTAGTHDVKLTLTNYNDYTTTVTIDPNQTTTITPTLTLSPGMTKVQASPSFVQPSFSGEIIDLGTLKFNWNGTGTVILEKTIVYDRLVLTGPNGIFDHTWTPCGAIIPEGPFNITNIFAQGYNEINVKIHNICGSNIGTVTGSIDITGPIILTCPIAPKYSGDTITLEATPKDGIGPYYVEFSKDGVPADPVRLGGPNPIYNVSENTTITRTYNLTDEDVRNASTGTITFSVFISDSCPIIAQTCTQECIVNIGCISPVCNFTVT